MPGLAEPVFVCAGRARKRRTDGVLPVGGARCRAPSASFLRRPRRRELFRSFEDRPRRGAKGDRHLRLPRATSSATPRTARSTPERAARRQRRSFTIIGSPPRGRSVTPLCTGSTRWPWRGRGRSGGPTRTSSASASSASCMEKVTPMHTPRPGPERQVGASGRSRRGRAPRKRPGSNRSGSAHSSLLPVKDPGRDHHEGARGQAARPRCGSSLIASRLRKGGPAGRAASSSFQNGLGRRAARLRARARPARAPDHRVDLGLEPGAHALVLRRSGRAPR